MLKRSWKIKEKKIGNSYEAYKINSKQQNSPVLFIFDKILWCRVLCRKILISFNTSKIIFCMQQNCLITLKSFKIKFSWKNKSFTIMLAINDFELRFHIISDTLILKNFFKKKYNIQKIIAVHPFLNGKEFIDNEFSCELNKKGHFNSNIKFSPNKNFVFIFT